MDEHAPATANKALSDEVLLRIGRNVLLFQQIEGLLKFLVVHCRADGTAKNFVARHQDRLEKSQTQTMGTLVRQYADGLLSDAGEPSPEPDEPGEGWISFTFKTSGDSDFYETQRADMKVMVEERNHLVHHFLPLWRPNSAEGLAEALAYLDKQRDKVLPMFEHLKTVSQSLRTARLAAASLIGSEEFESEFELSWLQQSSLVALLREVAVQKARADGWAYLADAGWIARAQEADAVINMKARYGHATLKRLLIATELFDVFDQPLPRGGVRTIYRLRSAEPAQSRLIREPGSPSPPTT